MNSSAAKVMFAPADAYDPTLSVDDLDDLFGERRSPETDLTLDVSSLGDFFSARQSFDDDLSDMFETPRPVLETPRPVLETPRPLLVLVRSREEPADIPAEVEVEAPVQIDIQVQAEVMVRADVPVHVEYEAVSMPAPIVTPAPAGPASEGTLSAIQRAVLDFERFAETFHAFARESQGLRVF